MKITESQIREIVKEAIAKVMESDRHREGYYKEYNAKRKAEGKPIDRHREGYYKERAAAKKNIAPKKQHKVESSEFDDVAMETFGKKYWELSSKQQDWVEKLYDEEHCFDDMRDEDGYGDWYPGDNW